MHPYTYIFVRTDIPFAQQLVQASHAALEAGFEFDKPDETSSIIVIPAANQEKLYEIAERLDFYDIKFKMFFEPDFDMGHSAIATQPITDKNMRFKMKKYPLYKFEDIAK